MKEFKSILSEFGKLNLNERKAALATVVRVRGSSYRSPGARMLITDDGKWVGSISGGCLEGDALRQARQVMTDGNPLTVTYDTREESNQNLGISLGCNGIIDVLIEPLNNALGLDSIHLFRRVTASKSNLALATIFDAPQQYRGRKILVSDGGVDFSNVPVAALETQLKHDLGHLLVHRVSQTRTYIVDDISYQVFVELIQPTISLVIFGGGYDARPVSNLAKALGWEVTITDECVAHIAPLFFPTADKLSLCQRAYIDRDIDITTHTACVLMSHNYEYDRDVLKKLLHSKTPFIGVLGPRKRFDKMCSEFLSEGLIISDINLDRIHSPVGLDIGAEAADEIAVSIIAEIQSKFSNRGGGSLKDRGEPIHRREEGSDQVIKQLFVN